MRCAALLATRVLNCCLVALFVWLASRRGGGLTTGKTLLLGSLYMVWAYAEQASSVIASVASHFQTFARQHADYASANIILDAVPATPPASASAKSAGGAGWNRVVIRDLTFRHSGSRTTAPSLERIGLSLQRGKRYALVGASGSGKSTRLCESAHGPAAPHAYAAALELACATDFVQPTPLGLEATVAERASNWSGGQRSRVALARGILAATGSALVLMDEPTANLDPATEARVYTNLFAAFADVTVISSLHRLSLLERFDEVLVMQEGRLVAQGSPDEPDLRQRRNAS